MKKIWKSIDGFEGLYEVSNFGVVRNMKNGYMKKGCPNEKGYLRVFLRKNKKDYTRYLHRLVAQAFIPNPDNKPTVNHKNGNKLDNRVVNLEWATHKEQTFHALKMGLIKKGEESPLYKRIITEETKKKMKYKRNLNKNIFNKKINQYDLNGNFIKTWECINDAIREYNNKAIQFCCKGRRKTASGYIWKYK